MEGGDGLVNVARGASVGGALAAIGTLDALSAGVGGSALAATETSDVLSTGVGGGALAGNGTLDVLSTAAGGGAFAVTGTVDVLSPDDRESSKALVCFDPADNFVATGFDLDGSFWEVDPEGFELDFEATKTINTSVSGNSFTKHLTRRYSRCRLDYISFAR